MIKTITIENVVARKTNHLQTAEFGDETVMMDLESGQYINLNNSGSVIWQYLEQPVKVKDLVQKLMQKYKVEEPQCTLDTLEYLERMLSENLVTVS